VVIYGCHELNVLTSVQDAIYPLKEAEGKMYITLRDYYWSIVFILVLFITIVSQSSAVTLAPYSWGDGKSCNVYLYIYSPAYNYTYTVPSGYAGVYPPHLKYLVVAGGGTGGFSVQPPMTTIGFGGGGGAGGLLYNESWNALPGETYNIYVGWSGNNSTIYNPSYSNITAIRGGNGGLGCPDNCDYPESGFWGGSGGGGGSGGSMGGYPPWQNLSPGGAGVAGQGYKGGPAFGGFALTLGGGGGGAGGEGSVEAGGIGFISNITLSNATYSEGGNDAYQRFSPAPNPCHTTFGSGGVGWWDPAQDCIYGNPGIIVIQECFTGTIISANNSLAKLVMFRVQTPTGKELTNATVSIQGTSTTAGTWDWVSTMLGIPLNEAPIQNTLMQGTTDSLGNIEFMMVPTTRYNVTTTLSGYTFDTMYIYPHDERYFIFSNVVSNTTNVTITPVPVVPVTQQPLSGTFQSTILMFAGVGMLFFTTMFAGFTAARHVAIIMCAEAWIFLGFGWFKPIVDTSGLPFIVGLFTLATLVAILWNLKEGFQGELGEL
jgi:hypothetical protein